MLCNHLCGFSLVGNGQDVPLVLLYPIPCHYLYVYLLGLRGEWRQKRHGGFAVYLGDDVCGEPACGRTVEFVSCRVPSVGLDDGWGGSACLFL